MEVTTHQHAPADRRWAWLARVERAPLGTRSAVIQVRVATAQATALLAAIVILAVDGSRAPQSANWEIALAIFIGLSGLHLVSVSRRLQFSTVALDGAAAAVLLAGTGAPASPLYFFAVAGVWWAAHLPRRRSGAVYGMAFVLVYAALVIPEAIRDAVLIQAVEDASLVLIVVLLADSFVRVDGHALELSEALARAPLGAEKIAIREGLKRAIGPMEISLDVLLAASRSGLTVIQAELLAYLTLGLTNQQIADATNVSDATVRYRLTRLYRALGVRDRKGARKQALELGIEAGDTLQV